MLTFCLRSRERDLDNLSELACYQPERHFPSPVVAATLPYFQASAVSTTAKTITVRSKSETDLLPLGF